MIMKKRTEVRELETGGYLVERINICKYVQNVPEVFYSKNMED